jgi:hypothetical protein
VSISMKARIGRLPRMKRKPSTIERMPGDRGSPSGGRAGRRQTAASVPRKVAPSRAYAPVTPTVPMKTPAIAGPSTEARLELRLVKLFAASSLPSPTSRGVIECWAPAPNANEETTTNADA